jgi:DNA-binding MarR family transcriptional regulator
MLVVAARRSIRQLIAAQVVPLELTPHHYWMLMVLYNGKPMSLGELARAMWMDNPTVSRMVQQMTNRGFLTVGPYPGHGRRILIQLTATGQTLCSQPLSDIHNVFNDASLNGFSTEELASFRELLCKYIRNLDTMVAAEAGRPLRPHHHEASEGHPKASGE